MYNRHEIWEEMSGTKKTYIEALKDKKFGMFIHFGVYSMLAGEWKGKRMEDGTRPFVAEWIMNCMKISREEYSALAKDFNPVDFSGEAFAILAKKAGMKYIVLTAKHHDGFALFHSKHSDYSMINTPCGADLVEDLHKACKKHGLDFCLYYSHSIDWYDGGDGGTWDYKNTENRELRLPACNNWDPSPQSFDDYIEKKAIPQVEELLTRYPDTMYMWFDVAHYIPEKYSLEFYKKVYELAPNCLVSHRVGNGFGDVYCPGDNKIIKDFDESLGMWETVGTMNNSWGFKHYDHDWKYPKEVLFWLIEIVSKGGNYILNIGPDQSGKIPTENDEILTKVGEWLQIYGESIFETRPWTITHEGTTTVEVGGTSWREKYGFNTEFPVDDFRFTQKEDKIYCISLYSGKVETLKITSLKDVNVKGLKLLGCEKPLKYTKKSDGIEIEFDFDFVSELGFAIEVTLDI